MESKKERARNREQEREQERESKKENTELRITGEAIEALEPKRRTNLKFLCGYLALGNTLILTVLTPSEIKPSPRVVGLLRGQQAHRAQVLKRSTT